MSIVLSVGADCDTETAEFLNHIGNHHQVYDFYPQVFPAFDPSNNNIKQEIKASQLTPKSKGDASKPSSSRGSNTKLACNNCRDAHTKCSGEENEPCDRCVQRGLQCIKIPRKTKREQSSKKRDRDYKEKKPVSKKTRISPIQLSTIYASTSTSGDLENRGASGFIGDRSQYFTYPQLQDPRQQFSQFQTPGPSATAQQIAPYQNTILQQSLSQQQSEYVTYKPPQENRSRIAIQEIQDSLAIFPPEHGTVLPFVQEQRTEENTQISAVSKMMAQKSVPLASLNENKEVDQMIKNLLEYKKTSRNIFHQCYLQTDSMVSLAKNGLSYETRSKDILKDLEEILPGSIKESETFENRLRLMMETLTFCSYVQHMSEQRASELMGFIKSYNEIAEEHLRKSRELINNTEGSIKMVADNTCDPLRTMDEYFDELSFIFPENEKEAQIEEKAVDFNIYSDPQSSGTREKESVSSQKRQISEEDKTIKHAPQETEKPQQVKEKEAVPVPLDTRHAQKAILEESDKRPISLCNPCISIDSESDSDSDSDSESDSESDSDSDSDSESDSDSNREEESKRLEKESDRDSDNEKERKDRTNKSRQSWLDIARMKEEEDHLSFLRRYTK